MRFLSLLTCSAVAALPAFAASPVTFSGVCPDGLQDYAITVDLDDAALLGGTANSSSYQFFPAVDAPACGGSSVIVSLQIGNDGANGCLVGDWIWLGGGFSNPIQPVLVDPSGTALDSTALSTTGWDASLFSVTRASDGPCSDFGSVLSVASAGPLEELTLLERATEARDLAEQTYSDLGLAGTPRLQSAAAMESYLSTPVTLLEGAGCELDGQIGGAYDLTTLAAEDDAGELTAVSFDRGAKSWTGTMSTGEVITGGYNNQAQSFGARDDGGFYVGRFVQTRGTRGTSYGVTGTCPTPIDYDSVVGGWYRGPLPTP